MLNNYFPQGVASGDSFLGRSEELGWLCDNIKANHHTLLIAPRRYGKTSLAMKTLKELGLPYVDVNFHLALSARSVEKKILKGVQDLLHKVMNKPEQILTTVQSFFKTSKKSWTIGFKGIVGLEIVPDHRDESPDNILTALNLIDYVLAKKNKKAVIFFDEVQEIDSLPEGRQIEGALRQFAQSSKQLVFVFSGSNRRMLLHMFDDRSMPLYELCDRIILDRIKEAVYRSYLDKVAKETWGNVLPGAVFDKIMAISDRHPKRIYNLCYYFWKLSQNNTNTLTVEDVVGAWDLYVKQRIKDVRYMLSRLSAGQLKVLALVASHEETKLTGKSAQRKIDMAGSSITKASQYLEENDYIEKEAPGSFRMIDPLIKDILLGHEYVC